MKLIDHVFTIGNELVKIVYQHNDWEITIRWDETSRAVVMEVGGKTMTLHQEPAWDGRDAWRWAKEYVKSHQQIEEDAADCLNQPDEGK